MDHKHSLGPTPDHSHILPTSGTGGSHHPLKRTGSGEFRITVHQPTKPLPGRSLGKSASAPNLKVATAVAQVAANSPPSPAAAKSVPTAGEQSKARRSLLGRAFAWLGRQLSELWMKPREFWTQPLHPRDVTDPIRGSAQPKVDVNYSIYSSAASSLLTLQRRAQSLDDQLSDLNLQRQELRDYSAKAILAGTMTSSLKEQLEKLNTEIEETAADIQSRYQELVTQVPILRQEIDKLRNENWQRRQHIAQSYDVVLEHQINVLKQMKGEKQNYISALTKDKALQAMPENVQTAARLALDEITGRAQTLGRKAADVTGEKPENLKFNAETRNRLLRELSTAPASAGLALPQAILEESVQIEQRRYVEKMEQVNANIEKLLGIARIGTQDKSSNLQELGKKTAALTQNAKLLSAMKAPKPVASTQVRDEVIKAHSQRLHDLEAQFQHLENSIGFVRADVSPALMREKAAILKDIQTLRGVLQNMSQHHIKPEEFDVRWNHALDEAAALQRFAKELKLDISNFKAKNVAARLFTAAISTARSEKFSEDQVQAVIKEIAGEGGQGCKLALELSKALHAQIKAVQKGAPQFCNEAFLDTLADALENTPEIGRLPNNPNEMGEQIGKWSADVQLQLLRTAQQNARNAVMKKMRDQHLELLKKGDDQLIAEHATPQNIVNFVQTMRQRIASLRHTDPLAFSALDRSLDHLQQMGQLERDPRLFQTAVRGALLLQRSHTLNVTQRSFIHTVQRLNAAHNEAVVQLANLDHSLQDMVAGRPPTWTQCRGFVAQGLVDIAGGVQKLAGKTPQAEMVRRYVMELLLDPSACKKFIDSMKSSSGRFAQITCTMTESETQAAVKAGLENILLLSGAAGDLEQARAADLFALDRIAVDKCQAQLRTRIGEELLAAGFKPSRSAFGFSVMPLEVVNDEYRRRVDFVSNQLVKAIGTHVGRAKVPANELSEAAEQLLLIEQYYRSKGLKEAELQHLMDQAVGSLIIAFISAHPDRFEHVDLADVREKLVFSAQASYAEPKLTKIAERLAGDVESLLSKAVQENRRVAINLMMADLTDPEALQNTTTFLQKNIKKNLQLKDEELGRMAKANYPGQYATMSDAAAGKAFRTNCEQHSKMKPAEFQKAYEVGLQRVIAGMPEMSQEFVLHKAATKAKLSHYPHVTKEEISAKEELLNEHVKRVLQKLQGDADRISITIDPKLNRKIAQELVVREQYYLSQSMPLDRLEAVMARDVHNAVAHILQTTPQTPQMSSSELMKKIVEEPIPDDFIASINIIRTAERNSGKAYAEQLSEYVVGVLKRLEIKVDVDKSAVARQILSDAKKIMHLPSQEQKAARIQAIFDFLKAHYAIEIGAGGISDNALRAGINGYLSTLPAPTPVPEADAKPLTPQAEGFLAKLRRSWNEWRSSGKGTPNASNAVSTQTSVKSAQSRVVQTPSEKDLQNAGFGEEEVVFDAVQAKAELKQAQEKLAQEFANHLILQAGGLAELNNPHNTALGQGARDMVISLLTNPEALQKAAGDIQGVMRTNSQLSDVELAKHLKQSEQAAQAYKARHAPFVAMSPAVFAEAIRQSCENIVHQSPLLQEKLKDYQSTSGNYEFPAPVPSMATEVKRADREPPSISPDTKSLGSASRKPSQASAVPKTTSQQSLWQRFFNFFPSNPLAGKQRKDRQRRRAEEGNVSRDRPNSSVSRSSGIYRHASSAGSVVVEPAAESLQSKGAPPVDQEALKRDLNSVFQNGDFNNL